MNADRRLFSFALAGSLLAGNATSALAAPYPTTGPRDARLLRLVTLAAALKSRACISTVGLQASGLLAENAAASLALDGSFTTSRDAAMRLFFATALPFVGHSQNPLPIVGMYSPVLDFWWLLQVDNGPTPRALQAAFIPGGGFGGAVPGEAPRLVAATATASMFEALRRAVQQAATEFGNQFPRDGSTAPVGFDRLVSRAAPDLLARRMLVQLSSLSAFGAETSLYKPLRAVLIALRQELPGLPPAVAGQAASGFATIAGVTPALRAGLLPVAAFQTGARWLVVSGNAATGRIMIISAHDPAAAPTLVRLGMIDLLPGVK